MSKIHSTDQDCLVTQEHFDETTSLEQANNKLEECIKCSYLVMKPMNSYDTFCCPTLSWIIPEASEERLAMFLLHNEKAVRSLILKVKPELKDKHESLKEG